MTAGWTKVFVALSQQGSHGEQVWQLCPHLDRQRSLWTVDLLWIQRVRRRKTSFYVVWNVCWTKTRTKKKWPGPRIGRAATVIVSVAGPAMRTMTSERNYNLFTDTDMGESDDKKPAFMQPWNVTSKTNMRKKLGRGWGSAENLGVYCTLLWWSQQHSTCQKLNKINNVDYAMELQQCHVCCQCRPYLVRQMYATPDYTEAIFCTTQTQFPSCRVTALWPHTTKSCSTWPKWSVKLSWLQ